jgi:hypothetical protein
MRKAERSRTLLGREALLGISLETSISRPSGSPVGPPMIGMGCDMREGSSGGGWIIRNQYVNSVTSGGYDTLPELLFGPYFGDAVGNLYNGVCC